MEIYLEASRICCHSCERGLEHDERDPFIFRRVRERMLVDRKRVGSMVLETRHTNDPTSFTQHGQIEPLLARLQVLDP